MSAVLTRAVPAAAREQSSPDPLHPDRLDVLVVEDDPDGRWALHMTIQKLGHRCRAAADGAEALRLVEERRPDVVISDWEMPGMTGADVCRRVRETDDASYIYFILLSALHDREHLLAGMDAGADDYQKKPVDRDELEARLLSAARVVGLHRQLADRELNLRRDSSQFRTASRTDPLTGVGNRLRMDEELASAWARAERYGHRFSAALVDVDHFKAFNDGFGHLAGDEALKSVASAIRRVLRAGDAVYRYGGEEFVVLLPEQSRADAMRALERVRAEVIATGIRKPASDEPLTISAGVAELDVTVDTNVGDWLRRADSALYVAKSNGRNRVETTAPAVSGPPPAESSDGGEVLRRSGPGPDPRRTLVTRLAAGAAAGASALLVSRMVSAYRRK